MDKQQNSIYLNPASGIDTNSGDKANPLRTLTEAARRVNTSEGDGPLTVILAAGIYAIGETTLLKPELRSFSATARLTLRAEVLPDDPAWHTGAMPTLIHTMPFPVPPTWNGNPDPLGGAVNGMVIETSHVTIQGLKFLGLPVVETPQSGLKRRMYAIARFDPALEDLEVAQCLFAGNALIAPLHVGIIARGNRLVVHHCIFHGFMKDPVVFWSGGSSGHALHHCIIHGSYGSSIYTAGIANDLDYHHNIVDSCVQVWVYQNPQSAQRDAQGQAVQLPNPGQANLGEGTHYQAIDSLFANNQKFVASGVGAKMEFQEIGGDFIEMIGTTVSEHAVALEQNQMKRNYLHPIAGSDAAELGAGLFQKQSV